MRSAGRAAAVAVVLAVLVPAAPARAGTAAGGGPSSERQPSDAQVLEARQRAEALRGSVQARTGDVAAAALALEAAAADSALALESYAASAQVRREAMTELSRREEAVALAEVTIDRERSALARWAREAYVDGGTLGTSPGVYTLLAGGTTDDVATHQAWLQRAGRSRADVVARWEAALEVSRRAVDEADRAATAAEAAAAQVDAALAARNAVLDAQRRRLADLQLMLAGTRRAAENAERSATDLAAARSAAGRLWSGPGVAGYPAGNGAGNAGNAVTGQVGDCPGGDVAAYGNGVIPLGALCPLAGAPGELLRADAAYAFNGLTAAYAARFGRPVCVTDSYRSYDDQVRVRAERPGLAAFPGRSNHGWGTALDLCGGVERFDSAEHAWLRVNAPLVGWFHPAWAGRGGTLPEPWHWEYSG
ncbi:MAG TPA: M15 family metallopeptidase [Dermatophilaceae bacterium]|nr:M15 family metallopeptidase [Dermatophilaceae bacterium]